MDLVPSPTPLAAGTYTRAGFEPAITFEIGEADAGRWTAVQSFEGFFDVQEGVGTPDVIAVQFARVVAVFGAGAAAVPVTRAAEAIAALESNPGLAVVEASPAVMAGHEGRGVTVDHVGPETSSPVIAVPPGPISILPGRRLWLGFFDTTSGLVAILVGGSIVQWAEAVTAAQPILASVRIADRVGR
jgi:hypothetical protein